MNKFEKAFAELNDSVNAGKPLEIARAREAAMNDAFVAMAEELGANVETIMPIFASGEVMVKAMPEDERDRHSGICGHYGEAFAAWLNKVPFRTGSHPHTGYVMPVNGWGYVNHFDIERLIRWYAEEKGIA